MRELAVSLLLLAPSSCASFHAPAALHRHQQPTTVAIRGSAGQAAAAAARRAAPIILSYDESEAEEDEIVDA